MTWLVLDTWIVVIGSLCAVACAVPGAFLVLRGQSMMGDAISHAVLPGLAVAYLLTGDRSSLPMFIGAAAVGVLTAVFSQLVSSFGRVDRGAALGVVFTTLFALGLLLIVRAADHVDLDPGCVLYGAIEWTPTDLVDWWWAPAWMQRLPRAAVVLAVVAAMNLAVTVLLFKEMRIASFDPALARTVGIPAGVLHYVLMTLVAVTTVASFEAVGSIIVIALLIVPGATAQLLSDRLATVLVIAVAVGVASVGLGHVGAVLLDEQAGRSVVTSGAIATALGAVFTLAWVLGPRHGLLGQYLAKRHVDDAPPPEAFPEAFPPVPPSPEAGPAPAAANA